jgi:hypothetical protein
VRDRSMIEMVGSDRIGSDRIGSDRIGRSVGRSVGRSGIFLIGMIGGLDPDSDRREALWI